MSANASLPPEDFDIHDLEGAKEIAGENYLKEVKLVNDVAYTCHGPRYITHSSQEAGPDPPCPGTPLRFIVMSQVSGEDLNTIYGSLGSDKLENVRSQFAYVLE